MISNGKKVNQVFQTKNYGIFKFRNDNRVVNPTHVKKLSEKMKNIGWIPGSYVVINEKGEIIDGQHRVTAAMSVGVPISYTIERKSNFDTIRSLNQNQKKNNNFIILKNEILSETPSLG